MKDMHCDIQNILFSKTVISAKIKSLGRTITKDYVDKDLTIISLMTGSLLFTADLIREINIPISLYTITVSSYNGGKVSSGTLNIKDSLPNCKGKDVLIVDDILDTGLTLSSLKTFIEEFEPSSVKTCVLLNKKIERTNMLHPDYFGFEIDKEFVVGYGLDFNGIYRNLPYVGILKN